MFVPKPSFALNRMIPTLREVKYFQIFSGLLRRSAFFGPDAMFQMKEADWLLMTLLAKKVCTSVRSKKPI
jgi:hypothetical protein